MRSIHTFLRSTAACAVAFLLLACGSGGGQVAGIDRGGAPIAVASSGTITGFGSIFVNGVRYETNGANIRIDDVAGTQADLRVGQVVTVTGTLDTGSTTRGTAQNVSFNAAVEGPIQAIDAAASTLTVLGQTVRVTSTTSFGDSITPRSLAGLAVGAFVEVSGFPQSSGTILATRIEREQAGEMETTGTISALDNGARRFQINALLVDYSQATLEAFNGASPANGDRVEVEGTILTATGALIATRVARKGSPVAGISGRAEIEGSITRFTSAADFAVNGQAVITNAATRYEDGTAADLALDVAVEVDGVLDAQGRLVAEEIEFRSSSELLIAGPVMSVNATARTLNVIGVDAEVIAVTRFEDRSAANVVNFSLADVRVGDYVEVRGYAGTNRVVATLLERDEAQSEVEIRGPATNVMQPELTVLGVRVMTGGATEFKDATDNPIGAGAFFAAAASGRLVEISGTLIGNVIQADEAEIEN